MLAVITQRGNLFRVVCLFVVRLVSPDCVCGRRLMLAVTIITRKRYVTRIVCLVVRMFRITLRVSSEPLR